MTSMRLCFLKNMDLKANLWYNNKNIYEVNAMIDKSIARINELAKKSKTEQGLTEEEKAEQAKLRQEYIAGFKNSLQSQLDNIDVVDHKGNATPLKRKG